MDYASGEMLTYQFFNKILLGQKRAIRAVAGLDYRETTKEAFRDLKILKVTDLFKFQLACVMWDHDHGALSSCLAVLLIKSLIHTIPELIQRKSSRKMSRFTQNLMVNQC